MVVFRLQEPFQGPFMIPVFIPFCSYRKQGKNIEPGVEMTPETNLMEDFLSLSLCQSSPFNFPCSLLIILHKRYISNPATCAESRLVSRSRSFLKYKI